MKMNLKEWLAKVTGQTEFKTLLWTNNNPASTFLPQTISLDLSKYNEIEVWFITHISNPTYIQGQIKTTVGGNGALQSVTGTASDITGGLIGDKRQFTTTATGVTFGSGNLAVAGNTWYVDNNHCVPVKIYGIRYVGGVVRKLLKALKPLTLERGWAV